VVKWLSSKRLNFRHFRHFSPGPDLSRYNRDYAVLPGLINNIEIAIFAKEVAPPDPDPVSGRGGRAHFRHFHIKVT